MESSKSITPFILKLDSFCQVAEYHIPPRLTSHSREPSRGISCTSAESPGIPFSLNDSVCSAKIIICDAISPRSIEPSNSSIIGTMETSIRPIIETTPPKRRTVATAADTASSSRVEFNFIFEPPLAEYSHLGKGEFLVFQPIVRHIRWSVQMVLIQYRCQVFQMHDLGNIRIAITHCTVV